MAPIVVDPAVLSGAGASVTAAGDGLAAAVAALAGSTSANTGYDAAGVVFGRQYVATSGELLRAITSGVNACRNVGYGVQVSAVNYSRAEAASDLSGHSQALPSVPCPAPLSAPGSPSSSGASVPPPLLWSVVQQFVGSVWPDGNPAELRAAAAAWRAMAGPLNSASADVSGARSAISGQHIDEGAAITGHIDGIGTGLTGVASSCAALAASVEQYAAKVEQTQQAIRGLCDRLGSIGGIVGTFFEFVKGHGLDEVHEIADEIKTVIAHLGSETDATLQLLESAKQSVDSWVLDLEKSANKEFVDFFGEPVGTVLSSQFDRVADSGEAVFRWGAGSIEGIAALNPTRFASDPEGAKQTWEGIAKLGSLLGNPAAAVLGDPHGTLETVKGLVHAEDWSKDRPMLGATEVGLDVVSAGLGMSKAGALGKAGGAERGVVGSEETGTTLRAGGESSSSTSALNNLTKDTAKLNEKLDGIANQPISPTPPAGGRPVPLPGDLPRGAGPMTRAPETSVTPGHPAEPGPAAPAAHTPDQPSEPPSETKAHAAARTTATSGGSHQVPAVVGDAEKIPEVNGTVKPVDGRAPSTIGEPVGSGGHDRGAIDASGRVNQWTYDGDAARHDLARTEGHVVDSDAKAADAHESGQSHRSGNDGVGWDDGSGHHDTGTTGPDVSSQDIPPPLPPDSPLFNDYTPIPPGSEFTNPDGSLIYPDDSLQSKPYAIPGSVIDNAPLAAGTEIGRFGYPGGSYMAPDGTLFAELSLPPDSALKPYFRYVVNDGIGLPPGWRIEQSQVAPWFHQPGGGIQYRILDEFGKSGSVEDLLRWGYLRKVN